MPPVIANALRFSNAPQSHAAPCGRAIPRWSAVTECVCHVRAGAPIDRRAAGQQRVRPGRSAVVCQGSQPGSVGLQVGLRREPAEFRAAEVVAVRSDRIGAVVGLFLHGAVTHHDAAFEPRGGCVVVDPSPMTVGRAVAGDRALAHVERAGRRRLGPDVDPAAVRAAVAGRGVSAQGAVGDLDAAAPEREAAAAVRGVGDERAAAHRERSRELVDRAAESLVLAGAEPVAVRRIALERGVTNDQRPLAVETAAVHRGAVGCHRLLSTVMAAAPALYAPPPLLPAPLPPDPSSPPGARGPEGAVDARPGRKARGGNPPRLRRRRPSGPGCRSHPHRRCRRCRRCSHGCR